MDSRIAQEGTARTIEWARPITVGDCLRMSNDGWDVVCENGDATPFKMLEFKLDFTRLYQTIWWRRYRETFFDRFRFNRIIRHWAAYRTAHDASFSIDIEAECLKTDRELENIRLKWQIVFWLAKKLDYLVTYSQGSGGRNGFGDIQDYGFANIMRPDKTIIKAKHPNEALTILFHESNGSFGNT